MVIQALAKQPNPITEVSKSDQSATTVLKFNEKYLHLPYISPNVVNISQKQPNFH